MSAPPGPGRGGDWTEAVARSRARLEGAFDALIAWCDEPAALLETRATPQAWSAREVLEHVVLADRFLLLLVEKLAARGLRRAAAGALPPAEPQALEDLELLALPEHRWSHPAHMAPTGSLAPRAAARELAAQRARCLRVLADAPAGEGALHSVRMSALPGGTRRLDLYGYLTVVALHAERHRAQLERTRARYVGGR